MAYLFRQIRLWMATGDQRSVISLVQVAIAKRYALVIFIAAIALFTFHFSLFTPKALAAVGIYRPINYQGKLSSTGGIALTNGVYNMRFKIFSATTGGVPLWTETWNNTTQRVTSTGGLFSIALGTHVTMTGSVDFNSDSLFLQVEFDPGNDGTYEEVFAPRRRFASVPYAHNANALDGLDSTQFIRADANSTSTGVLTINLGSNLNTIGLKVLNTISGAHIHAERTLSSSGTLVWEGTASGNALRVMADSYFMGKLGIGTSTPETKLEVVGTISGSLITQNGGGNNYLLGNVGIGTASPAEKLDVSGAGAFSETIKVTGADSTRTGTALFMHYDTSGDLGAIFAYNYTGSAYKPIQIDALNLRLLTGGNERMRIDAVGNVGIGTTTPRAKLEVNGAMSGATLFVQTFSGAGLTDCDATTQKLYWDTTTEKFSCGTDYTGSFGTGNVLTIGDARYVNQSGDTMTGALVINITNGNFNTLGLRVLNTLSGAHLHAEKLLTASGFIIAESGALIDGGTLYVDAGNNRVGIGTTSPVADLQLRTRMVLQGVGNDQALMGYNVYHDGTNWRYIASDEGAAIRMGDSTGGPSNGAITFRTLASGTAGATVSGMDTTGVKMTITNGGYVGIGITTPRTKLEVNGSMSGSTLFVQTFSGAGLVDCDATTQKLLWDTTTEKFSCGTDYTGSFGTGNVLTIGDARYVNQSGDTMTGALVINITNGNFNTLGLRVLNTLSGAHLHAEKLLTASGFIIGESGALLDAGTFYVDAGNNRVGIGTTSPDAHLSIGSTNIGTALLDSELRIGVQGADNKYAVLRLGQDATHHGIFAWYADTTASDAYMSIETLGGNNLIAFQGSQTSGNVSVGKTSAGARFDINTGAAGNKGLIVQGFAAQTANLQEWHNSASAALSFITPSGSGSFKAIAIGKTPVNGRQLDVVGTISGSLITQNGAGNNYFLGNVGINTVTPRAKLEVAGSISGSTLFVQTFSGAGLVDCDATTQKLLWDTTTEKFSCATDQGAWSNTGALIGAFDTRYVNQSGDTMTGALTINVTSGNFNTLGLRVLNTLSGAHLHAERTLSSSGTLFVESGAYIDGTTLVVQAFGDKVGIGTATPRQKLEVRGNLLLSATADGDYLTITDSGGDPSVPMYIFGIDTDSQALIRPGFSNRRLGLAGGNSTTAHLTISTSGNVGIGTITPRAKLEVAGSMSGATLFVQTFSGAGLVDCDAATQKILWDTTTEKFSCATDQGAWSNTGALIGAFDTRYVNQSGDTMTGALTINVTSGNFNTVGLKVINTLSGAHLHAEKLLTASGNVIVEGGQFLAPNGSVSAPSYSFTDAPTSGLMQGTGGNGRLSLVSGGTAALYLDSSNANATLPSTFNFGFSNADAAAGSIDTYLRREAPGVMEMVGTFSGYNLTVSRSASISGTLLVKTGITSKGSVSGSTIDGFGLGSCNGSSQKLLYNSTTDKFECGTISASGTFGTGNVLTIGDARYLKRSGGTMTGVLVVDITSGNFNTVGLKVINTLSGAHLHAEKLLTSSGMILGESGVLLDGGTFYVDAGNDRVGIGTASPAEKLDVSGAGAFSETIKVTGADSTRTGTALFMHYDTSGDLGAIFAYNYTGSAYKPIQIDALNLRLLTGGNERMRIDAVGSVGIATTTPRAKLEVAGSISGSTLFVQTFSGAGLVDCDATTQKLLWDTTTEKFSCATDQGAWSNTGALIGAFDTRYVNQSGDTMTGALTINVTSGNFNTIGLKVLNTLSGAHLHAEKLLTASGFIIGESGALLDGGTFYVDAGNNKVGIGNTNPQALLHVGAGTDAPGFGSSANTLYVSGNGQTDILVRDSTNDIVGGLSANSDGGNNFQLRAATGHPLTFAASNAEYMRISAAGFVGIGTTTPRAKLEVNGSMSGATLFVQTFSGAGLVDCDVSTQKLLWDTTTEKFSCATDQGAWSNTGALIGAFDTRYVNQSGDTMTGALTINVTSGNFNTIGLKIINTASGAHLHAERTLSSSGNLIVEGTMSGMKLIVGGAANISGALLVKGTLAAKGILSGQTLTIQSSGTVSGALLVKSTLATRGTLSGQTLTIMGGNSYMLGSLGIGTTSVDAGLKIEIIGTASGRNLFAMNGMSASGSLSVEQRRIIGSGALVVEQLASSTGVYIKGSGSHIYSPLLALDSSTGAYAAPHIMYGYKGTFDVSVWKSAGDATLNQSGSLRIQGGTGRTLLTLDTESATAQTNVFKIVSEVATGFGGKQNNLVFRVTASGAVYSDSKYNSAGADYAEWFIDGGQKRQEGQESLKPGDIVCIDILEHNAVKRCERSADPNVMGIISTNPAFVGNNVQGADGVPQKGYVLVGLIGQVPARINLEGGVIRPGDSLTSSSVPGFARRAVSGESTVGVALEGFDGSSLIAQSSPLINVLISRRNQSMTVEAVEQKVLDSIAEMNLSDEVELMVQSSSENLGIDARVRLAFENELKALDLSTKVDALVNRRLSGAVMTFNGSLTPEQVRQITSTILPTLGGTGSDSLFAARQVIKDLEGRVTVLESHFQDGVLHAAGGVIDNDFTVNGTLRLGSGITLLSGRGTIGPIGISGSEVEIGSLMSSGSLKVVGPITVSGLATFLGDVHVKGQLVLSSKQAGFAVIPATGTSVTVRWNDPLVATPIVTATPDVPVLFAVSQVTPMGFTVRIAGVAAEKITFAYIALAADQPGTVMGTGAVASGEFVPFHIDSQGRPYTLTNSIWNQCIIDPYALDACNGFHQGSLWFTHPDIVESGKEAKSFTYDAAVGATSLVLPPEYLKTVADQPAEPVPAPVTEPESSSSASSSASSESSSSSASSESSEGSSSSASSDESADTGSSSSASSESSSASSEPSPPPPPAEEPAPAPESADPAPAPIQ